MSERKGLLTKDQESFFADLLDDAIKFKNPILEGMDKTAFKLIISAVDNNLADRIPEDWKNPLEPVIDAAMDERWEESAELAADLLNEKIDIPGIDEASEQAIFSGVLHLIVGAIIGRAEAEK